jgi:hypothetical protein
VLAFLHFQTIVAGDGLNTTSRMFSALIARYHPTAKKLFAKGPRLAFGCGDIKLLEIGKLQTGNCWCAWIDNGGGGDRERCHLPLPLVPVSREILALGNIYVKPTNQTYHLTNPEVFVCLFIVYIMYYVSLTIMAP